MKYCFIILLCIFAFPVAGHCRCPKNSDSLYNREKLLLELEDTLKTSIPIYENLEYTGFFVYDLTDSPNNFLLNRYNQTEGCINFIDGHVYHFSTIDFEESFSHIAFLENGKVKIFKSINCVNGEDNLSDVVEYAEKTLKKGKKKDETLIRLKNYRRYGFYRTTDSYRVSCNWKTKIPDNSDKLYDRYKVLDALGRVFAAAISKETWGRLFQHFFIEESRGNGFFVYDLTEPSNKQTSLLERVEFKNNHVYHFALIDLPFSFSNIVVLEDGKLKIFKTVNCKGKGDSMKDVIAYLNGKLKNDKNKDEIIKRVKNYREYGVYASFKGLSAPQCAKAVSAKD
ncbi:MAG TPA: hypothetical protein VF721_22485 [Pyrinomonadaceae bacterium]|jgi:hypothetical protein